MMASGNETARVWPTLTADLHPSENLIVWSYRSWAMAIQAGGEQRWRLLQYEYRRQFGLVTSDEALARFSAMMRQIGENARVQMSYHAPCCPCLGEQEVSVMSLVAACQARQWSLARRIANCLVEPDAIGTIIAAAEAVSDLMRRHLPPLPLRLGQPAEFPNTTGRASMTARAVDGASATIH